MAVSWSPPGWRFEVTAWRLAVLGALAWSSALAVRRVRRRRARSAPDGSVQIVEDDAPVEDPSRGGRENEPHNIR